MRFTFIKDTLAFAETNGQWPSRYLQFVYRFSWNITLKRVLALNSKAHFWTRNSYQFNKIIPGLSDIDVTLVSDPHSSHTIYIWNHFKKIFPWFGEINYYPIDIAKNLLIIANPGEIKRDPKLLSFFKFEPTKITPSQTLVVILRMLLHDTSSLKKHPVARRAKWDYGLRLLDLSDSERERWISNLNYQQCLDLLLERLPAEEVSDFRNELEKSSDEVSWLYPQKLAHLKQTHDLIASLSDWKKQIVIEQCLWEFWGVMTQTHWLQKPQYQQHLKNIYALISTCKIPLDPVKNRAIEEILEYIEKN
ncbi:MAG: hypothetical protein K2P81_05880 [Bacteriovoracaceae bacterium]|nr:hypothetical protein [Bacteriovoracaceae bacterium]